MTTAPAAEELSVERLRHLETTLNHLLDRHSDLGYDIATAARELARLCEALREDIEARHATAAIDAGLLTVAEVAEHLLCSESTVYREVRAGRIPAVAVASGYRIPRLALEQWLLQAGTVEHALKAAS